MSDLLCRCGEAWSFRGLHYTSSDLPWWRARDLIRGAGCPSCHGMFTVDEQRDARWRGSVERESEGEIFALEPWGGPYMAGDLQELDVVAHRFREVVNAATYEGRMGFVEARYLDVKPGELWAIVHNHLEPPSDRLPRDIRGIARATHRAWTQELTQVLGSDFQVQDLHDDLADNEIAILIGGYHCPSTVERKNVRSWREWYDVALCHTRGTPDFIRGLIRRMATPQGRPDPLLYEEALEDATEQASEEAMQELQEEVDKAYQEATGAGSCSVLWSDGEDVSREGDDGYPTFDGERFDEWLPTVFQPIGWSFHPSCLDAHFILAIPAGLREDARGYLPATLQGLALHTSDPIFEWGRYPLEQFLDPTKQHGGILPSLPWQRLPLHTRVQFIAYLKEN